MILTTSALAAGAWTATKIGAVLYGLGSAGKFIWDKSKAGVTTFAIGRLAGGKDFWPFLMSLGWDFVTGKISPEKGEALMNLVAGALPAAEVTKSFKQLSEAFNLLNKDPGKAIQGIVAGFLELIKCIHKYMSEVVSEGRIMLNTPTEEEKKEQLAKEETHKEVKDTIDYVSDVAVSWAVQEQNERNKQSGEVLDKLDAFSDFAAKHEDAEFKIEKKGWGVLWYDYDLVLQTGSESVSVPLKDVKQLVDNYHDNQMFNIEKVQKTLVTGEALAVPGDLCNNAESTNTATKKIDERAEKFMHNVEKNGFSQHLREAMKTIRDSDFIETSNGIIDKMAYRAVKLTQANPKVAENKELFKGFINFACQALGLPQFNTQATNAEQVAGRVSTPNKRKDKVNGAEVNVL